MSPDLAFVNVGQLVTPVPKSSGYRIQVVSNAAMQMRNGKVVWVGPESELDTSGMTCFDCDGQVVSPGLIDAHTHPVFCSVRANEFEARGRGETYEQIAQAGGGILATVAECRGASDTELHQSTLTHFRQMLRCGTTTLEAKSGYGLSVAEEIRQLEAIEEASSETAQTVVATCLAAHAVPLGSTADAWLDEVIVELIPQVSSRELARAVDAFVEQGYFEADHAERLALAAKDHGLSLRLHVDQLSDGGGAELAAKLGAVSADHLEQTQECGIEALANSATIPILLPASVFGLNRAQYPNARYMIDRGLEVVLATDYNPGSSPTPSLPFVMALAILNMKMTIDECFLATTVHASKSLGMSDRGCLLPGYRGDFVLWKCRDYREIACTIATPLASSVWIEGIEVWRD
jgi:imidazolonepropionase